MYRWFVRVHHSLGASLEFDYPYEITDWMLRNPDKRCTAMVKTIYTVHPIKQTWRRQDWLNAKVDKNWYRIRHFAISYVVGGVVKEIYYLRPGNVTRWLLRNPHLEADIVVDRYMPYRGRELIAPGQWLRHDLDKKFARMMKTATVHKMRGHHGKPIAATGREAVATA